MSFTLLVKPSAERDLQHAFLWYEEQRIGLGIEFIFVVEAEIKRIEREPFQYLVKINNIRRAITKRFPYAIYFIVDGSNIFILAITHLKMDSSIWNKRNLH